MERQHYIPRCYLKKFAVSKGEDKYFIEAYINSTQEIIPEISTKNICVDKNLYTLPWEANDKYALEKYYAKNVDEVYPQVYDLLTNDSIKFITPEERVKIIYTTMSLYFRTPIFLNDKNKLVDKLFSQIMTSSDKNSETIKYVFNGEEHEFARKDLYLEMEKCKLKNKENFIYSHLDNWHKFVKFKALCQICVSKLLMILTLLLPIIQL